MSFHYPPKEEDQREREGRNHCESKGLFFPLIDLVSAGLIRDPSDPSRALSTGSLNKTADQRRQNVWIYAVRDGQMNVAPDGNRGTSDAVKHETLFRNQPVDIAGEIHIWDGGVVEVNDVSGTYGTAGVFEVLPDLMNVVQQALQGSRLPASNPKFTAGERWQ